MMKKISLGLITFSLLLVAFSALATDVAAQPKKVLKKARTLASDGDKRFNKRDYQGAIGKYREAISLVPNFPNAHYWKGNAHYYLQQYDESLEELNTAYDQGYAPVIDIYRVRWYVNFMKKNYDDALADLRKGLEIDPTDIRLREGLGNVYYAKESFREALAAYNDVVERIPNNGNTYYNMAVSYYNLGKAGEQRSAAQNAINNGTQFMAQSFILIADSYAKERKFEEAAEAYEKSLNLRQDIFPVYHNLSDIYRNMNRFTDAIEVIKKGLRQFPRNGDLYVDLSWYYSLADMPKEAIGAAQTAIQFVPDQYMAYTNLCRAYNDNKEYDKAVSACNNALRLKENDGETYFYLGRANDFLGKPDVATKHYKKALDGLLVSTQNNPDYADGFYLLGNAYYANGLRDKAIDAYLRCLELSPRFSKARFNLGYMYFLKGDLDSAQAQYTALLDLDADLAGKLKNAMQKK
ncbi:MAG: tetratricopeptide repeat protein [Pyrinomonadaceae bacterium]